MMGKTNALNIYPDETTMAGDSMEIKINRRQKYSSTYKTKITRSTHVTGDPLLQCNDYTPNNTYNDCTQNELLASFHKILDGSPPFIGKNPKDTCNERFNLSLEKEKVLENFFRPLYLHDAPFKCKTPCTFDKYTTRFLNNAPNSETVIMIVFDRIVNVEHSKFSINGETFLTRVGGSVVSSERTLLWIPVSVLGISQISAL